MNQRRAGALVVRFKVVQVYRRGISTCQDTETGLSVAGWVSQVAKIMLAKQTISHQVEYITRQLVL